MEGVMDEDKVVEKDYGDIDEPDHVHPSGCDCSECKQLPIEAQLERYLGNITYEAMKQVIRCLFNEGSEGRQIIRQQVIEFNKMYPKGGE